VRLARVGPKKGRISNENPGLSSGQKPNLQETYFKILKINLNIFYFREITDLLKKKDG
jgi:hypothetical protein